MRSLVRSVVLGSVAVLAACSSETVVVAPGAGAPGTGPTCSGDAECSATASTPALRHGGEGLRSAAGRPRDRLPRRVSDLGDVHRDLRDVRGGEARRPRVPRRRASSGWSATATTRSTAAAALDTDAPTFKKILDPAAGHFMLKPPALAMGTPEYFGVCGDNLNEQGGGDGANAFFMGPALFSTDPAILGKRTVGRARLAHGHAAQHAALPRHRAREGEHLLGVQRRSTTRSTSTTSTPTTAPATTTTPTARSIATRWAR